MKGIQYEKRLNEKYMNMTFPVDEEFTRMFEQEQIGINSKFKSGEVVSGRVIKLLKDSVVVDIGYKSEGIISLQEFLTPDNKIEVKEGDNVEVYLVEMEDNNGNLVLSKEKANHMKIWDEIAVAYENDQLIEGKIVEKVKGGLSVSIGVNAFLPGSQIDLTPVRNLDSLIGNTYKFKIIKFNKKRANIVLSRRALLEKEREQLKKETVKHLEEGVTLNGIVKNITEYGAFIDLGGIDGLLHITDISWGRVNHPSSVFSIGDEVKVKILKYDRDTERVSLGMKQTLPDPWSEAGTKYKNGDKVKGKIVSITDYGAFVELEEGIEGLIHISEMSWIKRVKHPSKMVALGDILEVMVLDVVIEKRRISLGMKQLEPNPWEKIAVKYPIGSIVTGKIKNMTEFGLFIGIEEGVDGLVHISDISWTRKVKNPAEMFPKGKGQDVQAKVLNVDIQNERFALGIKQLQRDPWIDVTKNFTADQQVEGVVESIGETEILVLLENEIEAVLNPRDLTKNGDEAPSIGIEQGQKIISYVKKIDEKDRRIILTLHPKKSDEQESRKANKKVAEVTETVAIPTEASMEPIETAAEVTEPSAETEDVPTTASATADVVEEEDIT